MAIVRPAHVSAHGRHDPVRHAALALVVQPVGGLHQTRRGAGVGGGARQGGGVFGKAGAAVSGTGVKELRPDPLVEADAPGDLLDVGADLLAQVRHLVDEGDLRRQEGVGGVLDQFRSAPVGEEDRRLADEQGPVELGHHGAGAVVLHPHDDAIGALEVLDRRPLAQELRVGDHGDVGLRAGFAHDRFDLVAGADGHGGLGHQHGHPAQERRHFARGGVDEAQVGMAVAAARRRSHGDKHGVRRRNRLGAVGGEQQPALGDVAGDEILEARLVDRQDTLSQALDLGRVLVDAGHGVTEIGKTNPGDEPDIARPDHDNPHAVPATPLMRKRPSEQRRAAYGMDCP